MNQSSPMPDTGTYFEQQIPKCVSPDGTHTWEFWNLAVITKDRGYCCNLCGLKIRT